MGDENNRKQNRVSPHHVCIVRKPQGGSAVGRLEPFPFTAKTKKGVFSDTAPPSVADSSPPLRGARVKPSRLQIIYAPLLFESKF